MSGSYLNTGFQAMKGMMEYVMPVLQSSQFNTKAMLTPEEFVIAGEELSFRCPSWQWEAGAPDKYKDYLPKDKQYLITRNVPCLKRASQYAQNDALEEDIELDGDTWTTTHNGIDDIKEEIQDISSSIENCDIEASSTSGVKIVAVEHRAMNEDIPDIDDFHDENLLSYEKESEIIRSEEPVNPILKTRTYDIHICYDKYYSTPRVFLSGFDESGQVLNVNQILEDVSADHALKTVTMESHPNLNVLMASIHPCRHAEVMKRLADRHLIASGKTLTIEMYLTLFLKFFSSVIPTIEYDYTNSF